MIRNARTARVAQERMAAIRAEIEQLHQLLIRVVVARAGATSGTPELLARERQLEERRSQLEAELERLRDSGGRSGEDVAWQG